ncbi:hypothetical protein CapIbe_010146 [Capra ibex]
MQFGSPRAAGPSDGGLGEAGGGPWTPASPFGAEGEGGQGGLGEGSWGEGGTRPEAGGGSEAWGLPGHWDLGAEDPEPQLRRGLVLHRADAKLSRTRLHRPSGGACAPRSPRRPSPCSSPDLHQSPLHSACLSTGAGDSSAGPSASQPPCHPPPPPGAAAEWRPVHSTGPRSGRRAYPGGLGGSSTSIG